MAAKPALKLQVIESLEVKRPERSILYQRVAPPMPPPMLPATPVPEAKTLSPAEAAAAEARAQKKLQTVIVSATVFDRRVTELRCYADNHEYHAWSNIDFNHLAGHSEIETEDAVYLLILSIANESSGAADAAHQMRKELPPIGKRAGYLLSDREKQPPPPRALAPLDALHTYYGANRERLAKEYARRQAELIVHERWIKGHHPAPKDTVISFWPKRAAPTRAVNEAASPHALTARSTGRVRRPQHSHRPNRDRLQRRLPPHPRPDTWQL